MTTTTTTLTRYIVSIRHTPGLPACRQYTVLAESIDRAAQIAVSVAGLEGVQPAMDTSLQANVTVLDDIGPGATALPHQRHPRPWTPSQHAPLVVYRRGDAWVAGHPRDRGPYAVVETCVGERNRRRIWGVYQTYEAAQKARGGSPLCMIVRGELLEGHNEAWGDVRLVVCHPDGSLSMTN